MLISSISLIVIALYLRPPAVTAVREYRMVFHAGLRLTLSGIRETS
jgi:hypothetical protein